MQRLDRILAVIDPTADVQVGAAKAARLARLSGAALELFACDFDPALTGQPFFDTDQLRRLREEFIADRAAYLEDLADELRADQALFARVQSESAAKLATIPVSSKGVKARKSGAWRPVAALGAATAAAGAGLLFFRRRK